MNKTIQIFVLAVLCLFLGYAAVAQTIPLKIGDKVPDVTINNIINYKNNSAKLSDFKGKLLILDFWATWCSSCIESLNKIPALQEQFRDQVFILPVSVEKEVKVRSFFASNRKLSEFKLTAAVEDLNLTSLFPHQTVPHVIWISPDGRVGSITNAQYVNAANIRSALQGKELNWLQKDIGFTYDFKTPLAGRSGDTVGKKLYTLFTGYVSGAETQAGFMPDTSLNYKRYYAINHSILHLYALAYQNGKLVFAPNRRVLTTSDSSRYLYNSNKDYQDAWQHKNYFSYETLVPVEATLSEVRSKMRHDLDMYLNLTTAVEKRMVPCLILRFTARGNMLKEATRKREVALAATENKPFIHNSRLENLADALNQVPGMPTVLNQSGYTKCVDIDFENPLSDLKALNKVLQEQGLILVAGQRELDMFILSEKAATHKNRISIHQN